jgi:hypothetical protein
MLVGGAEAPPADPAAPAVPPAEQGRHRLPRAAALRATAACPAAPGIREEAPPLRPRPSHATPRRPPLKERLHPPPPSLPFPFPLPSPEMQQPSPLLASLASAKPGGSLNHNHPVLSSRTVHPILSFRTCICHAGSGLSRGILCIRVLENHVSLDTKID